MAGIVQAAPLATITLEDNANADANLDAIAGSYSLYDIALKGLASGDYTDLGTNASDRTFRTKASIQIGDGVGSALTTIKDTNSTLIFDNTKGLSLSTVGSSNHKLELGEKIVGVNGKPSGRNGCKLVFGTSVTLRGIMKLYGSTLRSTIGSINLFPGAVGLGGEIINCILFAETTFSIGNSANGNFLLIYNLDLVNNSAGNPVNVIANWGADEAERITVACGTPQRIINTGATVKIRDLVLIASPIVEDLRLTATNGCDLIEPIYTGNAVQIGTASVSGLREWWRFQPLVSSAATGILKLASIPVTVKDKNGTDLMGVVYTDSEGTISYNLDAGLLSIFRNVLTVRRFANAGPWEQFGPFTARYNLDGVTRPDYLGTSVQFDFPKVTGAFGDQLGPVLDVVKLVPNPTSGFEENRPGYT